MTERSEVLAVGDNPRVEIRIGSSYVWVEEAVPGAVRIVVRGRDAEAVLIDRLGDLIRISQERGRRIRVRLELSVPPGTDLDVSTGSSDITIEAPLAALSAQSGSGDIRSTRILGDCDLKTGSGDIYLGTVEGRTRIIAASGDVYADRVGGHSNIGTASGDIRIDMVGAHAELRSASGDIEVSAFVGDDLEVRTVSGDIQVGLQAGQTVDLNLNTVSGRVELPEPRPVARQGTVARRVSLKSVSGDLRIRRLV